MTARRDIEAITSRIRERSRASREAYLGRIAKPRRAAPTAPCCPAANLAHGFAVCSPSEKIALGGDRVPNLGIVTAYNDMLSAHQPFETFPALIKQAAREAGGIAQVAGARAGHCDGVTQGQPGMELSLFTRDVIAMAAAIGLFAQHVRAAVYLGVCDKIVPGLLSPRSPSATCRRYSSRRADDQRHPNDEEGACAPALCRGKCGRAELLEAEPNPITAGHLHLLTARHIPTRC